MKKLLLLILILFSSGCSSTTYLVLKTWPAAPYILPVYIIKSINDIDTMVKNEEKNIESDKRILQKN